MRATGTFLAIAFLGVLATQALGAELTEASVRELIAKVDKAIDDRNVDAIANLVSESADTSGTISEGASFRYDKSGYIQSLRASWSQVSSYTYQRTNEEIVISAGKATVTADVAESFVIEGKQYSTRGAESATIESIDGVLLLTKMTIEVSM